MEPYQQANLALREGEEYPIRLLKNAGLAALGGGAAKIGAKAAGSLIPAVGALINKYVPDNILTAGLKKIDPRFGAFLQGAEKEGYSKDDVRNFLEEKIEESQPKPEQKNPIEKESPDLHAFLQDEINKGRPTLEAGALAELNPKFKSAIEKLKKDHKTTFASILQSIYGESAAKSNPIAQQQAAPQAQPQPQQQQTGQGKQALLDIMQKINQRLGK